MAGIRSTGAGLTLACAGLGASLLGAGALAPAGAGTCRDPEQQALAPAGSFWMGSDVRERGLATALSGPDTVAANLIGFRCWEPASPP